MVTAKKKKHRRTFPLAYKRDIVREANACKRGELAPLLARERLTTSLLTVWRRELGAAENAAPVGTGARALPIKEFEGGDDAHGKLEREIAGWERKIELARQIIEARKRVRELEAELDCS